MEESEGENFDLFQVLVQKEIRARENEQFTTKVIPVNSRRRHFSQDSISQESNSNESSPDVAIGNHAATDEDRDVTVWWLYQVFRENKWGLLIFVEAVRLLDEFLRSVDVSRSQLQACASATPILASKLRTEWDTLMRSVLVEYSDYSILEEDIKNWEVLILSKLNWNLSSVPTLDQYLRCLLPLISSKEDIRRSSTLIYSLSLLDSNFCLHHPPRLRVLASILLSMENGEDRAAVISNLRHRGVLSSLKLQEEESLNDDAVEMQIEKCRRNLEDNLRKIVGDHSPYDTDPPKFGRDGSFSPSKNSKPETGISPKSSIFGITPKTSPHKTGITPKSSPFKVSLSSTPRKPKPFSEKNIRSKAKKNLGDKSSSSSSAENSPENKENIDDSALGITSDSLLKTDSLSPEAKTGSSPENRSKTGNSSVKSSPDSGTSAVSPSTLLKSLELDLKNKVSLE